MLMLTKSEIRMSKFETNSKSQCSNPLNLLFGTFEFLSLDIVSCFGFSASNLKIKQASPASPYLARRVTLTKQQY